MMSYIGCFEYKMQYTRYFAISLIEMDIYIFKMLQLAANAT